MDNQPQQLLDAALTLPESDRASLAASLIRSLDSAPDASADAAWAAEVERRVRSINDGSVELQPWDTVMAQLRERRNG